MKVFVLLLIALSGSLAWEIYKVHPREISHLREQIEEAWDEVETARKELTEMEVELEEAERKLSEASKRKEATPQTPIPGSPKVTRPESTKSVVAQDNSQEIASIETQIGAIKKKAQDQIRRLEENARLWGAELQKVQSIEGDFKEQRVDHRGKKHGVRTSDRDRAIFAAKKQARLDQINKQLETTQNEIRRIQSDSELWISQGEKKIRSLRE